TDHTRQTIFRVSLILASILAFGIRFVLLGKQPLSDLEAVNALQALNLAGGGEITGSSEAGYVGFTSIWFFLFGAGNFGARLLPALSGTVLAMSPWLFRKQLGERAALLLCFGLALDASWAAVSRQAFGMSWAALFTVLALAALLNTKSALLGVFTALAILGGPSFWQGAIGLGAAALIFNFVFRPKPSDQEDYSQSTQNLFAEIRWKQFVFWFFGTLVIVGTLLLTMPNGLNTAVNGAIDYISGWGREGQTSIGLMALGLVLSQPLGFFFAGIGAVRAFSKKDALDIFLFTWWLVSLVLAFIYPARDMTILGWSALPMLALAARQISSLVNPEVEHGWVAIGQGIIVFVLLVFAWLSYIAFFYAVSQETPTLVRVAATLIPFLLILGCIFAIRSWWSEETAGQGALWGLLAALMLWVVSAAWSSTGLGAHPEGQIWYKSPMLDEVDLLETTLSDLSTWKTREPGQLELVVEDIDSAGLRWVLRDYQQVKFVTSSAPSSSPAVIITTDKPTPGLADTYRGQDFVLRVKPVWQDMTFEDWLQWTAFKSVPLEKSTVVLWARADLFLDAEGFNP
ncbi:MAG: hypothetical protein ACYCXH_02960, partial [Bellilinea sp.]